MNHDLRYALVMLAALVALGLLLRRWQASLPLAGWQKLGLGLGGFCGAMLGAKLPFALSDWSGLVSGATWFADGKTILCGIVGGYFGVEVAKWALDIRTKTGDSFAVPVAVAVAIGRLACFVGGCCYGTPTSLPWGVRFQHAADHLPRHPTQLYEAAFHLTLAGILFVLQRRGLFRGQLIKIYILAYLAYRFGSEFIRPETRFALGLTGYQWAALALAPLFGWLWWRDSRALAAAPCAAQPSTSAEPRGTLPPV
ncbi:MAG: prolipoprotein diacylglyceryl transferase [Pirellulaceae bacterium]|nr:prolipoprotein diacylglyceryl transferase [Pirellulaceae bacterium]